MMSERISMLNEKGLELLRKSIHPRRIKIMKHHLLTGFITLATLVSVCSASPLRNVAPTPPMGWNSYLSYGTYCNEQACYDNLKVFVEKFKPLGYQHFVIDEGWYIEYELKPGSMLPTSDKGKDARINKDGYFIPSKVYFPNGIKPIAQECAKYGVKFGVHILRGMPRKAVELNTRIKGTKYFARDIVNTNSTCPWSPHVYGVNMSKPGAQEFYDGWIQLLADSGVRFIKADDIVNYPDEIAAVEKAITKCGQPILLSLSPGDHVLANELKLYEGAEMLRVTGDVWDAQYDIDKGFDAWLTWQFVPHREGFWFDLDLIPFGELQVMVPEGTTVKMAGEGTHRHDKLTLPQKETLITMRAMSASPLIMSGVLTTMDDVSLRLLTNKKMIACDQNGRMGHLCYNYKYIQSWITKERGSGKNAGWCAVFNRLGEQQTTFIDPSRLGLAPGGKLELYDVWGGKRFDPSDVTIEPYGCVFIRYKEKSPELAL
jgi:hypothetical protein